MPSSVLREFHYRPRSHELAVTFVSGRRYSYLDVPEATYRAMRESLSKGEYFNAHIRDHFAFRREPD